jgi:two-component system, LytTR family, sensor kinase
METTTLSPTYLPQSEPSVGLLPRVMARRISYHLLFWLVIFCYNTLYLGFLWNDYVNSFFEFVIILPFYIGITYFNIYYLIPKYLANQKVWQYIAILIALVLATVVCFQIITNQLVIANFCPKSYRSFPLFDPKKTIKECFYTVSLVGLVTGIKLTKDWLWQEQQLQVMEKQRIKTELEFLKSQIQPHFFFNTLNNLYSLSVRKSDLAPEVVLKLSDLMSYMLYESDNPETTLKKEIEHIQNYLDLEKLRFGNRLFLDFEIDGSTEGIKIPPLLLLPFIENAFKHGTSHENGELKLKILFKVQPQSVVFEVTNPRFVGNRPHRKKHKGLGMKNVKRRLDLLFGETYQLQVNPSESEYFISLELPI